MNRHKVALDILRRGTVIPATPLALDVGRKLDTRRQRALMRYYLDAGAGGIATAVHTTQFAIREPEYGLFEPVLKLVSEEIDQFEEASGKAIIRVAGVCGAMGQTLKEVELARRLGYDAVLLSPGNLSAMSEEFLLERARQAAEILPVIGFYLQPSVGGRLLGYEFWKCMCEIENVVAVKCAPFNRYQTLDVVRAAAMSTRAQDIALYTGNDDNIVVDLLTTYSFTENGQTVQKQFVGGLLGHWSVWTHTVVKLYEILRDVSSQDSFPKELLTLAAKITDANAVFFDAQHGYAGCIAGIHEVLRRQGLLEGIWCLDPRETLSPGQMEEIDRVYEMYPHLNDDGFVLENLHKWLT